MTETLGDLIMEQRILRTRAISKAIDDFQRSDGSVMPCCPSCGEELLEIVTTYKQEIIHTDTHKMKMVDIKEAVTTIEVEAEYNGEPENPEIQCSKCDAYLPAGFFDACGMNIHWNEGRDDIPDCIAIHGGGYVKGL